MKSRLLITVLFIQLATPIIAQDNFFRQYGLADGLGNSFIYSIEQGDDGYLWIGTAEGLYKFNGFDFQHFSENDSLTNNFISTIYKSFSGEIWLGHMNGGITHIVNSRFKKYVDLSGVNSSITSITEADTGTIWFSTQSGGIFVTEEGHEIVRISTPLDNELIFTIRHLSGNYFLVGTQESLYILEYHKDLSSMSERLRIRNYPSSKVVDIIKLKTGKYFVLTKDKGIYILSINPSDLTCDLTQISSDTNGDLNNIQGGRIVRLNELWVNIAGKGIIKYQIENTSGNLLLKGYINNETGLKSNEVRCIFEDREANIWLGMYGGGLLKLIDDNIKFLSYTDRIGSNHIYALSRDSSNIWLASDDLIAKVIPDYGQISRSFAFPSSLSGARANSIYCSYRGLIYLGFEKEGLYVFNPGNQIFKKLFLSGDALENSINHLTGKNNILWISTKKGVCKYNTSTGAMKWFSKNDGLPGNNIQQLYIDSSGRVLVATTCNAIYYIGPEDNINTLNNSGSFGSNTVIAFSEDNAGTLWVATYGNGVYRFKTDEYLNYTVSSGIVSDYCHSLIFDKSHKILVSYKGGFSQIDTETGKIRNYIYNEGIKSSSDFYSNAVLTDNQNNIWFGTSEGLVKLLSQNNFSIKRPPVLHIDAIYINKSKVRLDNNITLKPGNYEIRVEYTGINLTNPESVIYQTILEGYSPNWSDLSTRRTVVYEKVGYGHYEFKVKAFNEDDIEQEEPKSFRIYIRKPVYLSFWFYIALIPLMGLSLYQYIRIREKNLRTLQERLLKNIDEKTKEIIVKEEIIKERKKTEKFLIKAKEKAELSDKLKSSFLSNMSHEIRTPMNAIVGLSELLKEKGYSDEERNEFINLIVSNSHSLLGLIDDILDISKIESNQMNINCKDCLLYPLLNELFLRFSEEIRNREKTHLDFRLSVRPEDIDLNIEVDSIRLKQVLSKLLDNAIKFTDSGYILFGYRPEKGKVLFFVEDSGIGLSEDRKEIIFELFRKVEDNKLRLYRGTGLGLSLSQNLVKLMGGHIKVESEVNKGSRFYFSLPLKIGSDQIESASAIIIQDEKSPSWPGKKILIVEDDSSNFLLINGYLKSSGADIVRAENGIDALKIVFSEKKPDLIIMDIKLPGIDGYEVIRQIRKKNRKIPIIVNTAYAMEEDRKKSIEAGCNEYISKPTERKLMIDLINKFL